EALMGWYRSTEPGVRSRGTMYFAVNSHGQHAWGRWVGLSQAGDVITGWGGLARAETDAEKIVQRLMESNGASRGTIA
ncbi:MAG: hypothetical protein ACRCYU_01765, partial [Nocardioides sp.]